MGLSDLKNVPRSSSQTDIIEASITDGLISCSKTELCFPIRLSESIVRFYIYWKRQNVTAWRKIKYYNSIRNNSNPIASVQFWLNILLDLNTINSTYVQCRAQLNEKEQISRIFGDETMQLPANCYSTPAEKNKDTNIITYLRSAMLRSLHISLRNEDFPINSDFFPNSVTSVEKGRTPPTI